ncbi:hypothetical protein AAGS39_05280 [Flavobacterium sp. CGRL2]
MKKNIFLLGFFLLFSILVKAQIYNPIKWKTSIAKISDTEYELQAKAIIESGWHLYSQEVADGGPLPTTFSFSKTSDFQLVDNVKEEKGKNINDPVFKMQIKFFEKEAAFTQRIKILSSKPFKIKAQVEFMVCNDENCLPPSSDELEFNISPSAKAKTLIETTVKENNKPIVVDSSVLELKEKASIVSKEIVETPKAAVKKNPAQNSIKKLVDYFSFIIFLWICCIADALRFPDDPNDGQFFYQTKQNQIAGN